MKKYKITFDHTQKKSQNAVLINNVSLDKFFEDEAKADIQNEEALAYMRSDTKEGIRISSIIAEIVAKHKPLEELVPYAMAMGMYMSASSDSLTTRLKMRAALDPKIDSASSFCEKIGGDWAKQAISGYQKEEQEDVKVIAHLLAFGVISSIISES